MRSLLVPRVLVWLFDVTRRSGSRSRAVRSLSPSIGVLDRTLDLLSGRIAVQRTEPQLLQPSEDAGHMTHPSTARPHRAARPRSATKWRSVVTRSGNRASPPDSSDIPAQWPMPAALPAYCGYLTYHCCEAMKFWTRIVTCRQRKAHERYLVDRARQQVLQGQDAQKTIRGVAKGSAGWLGPAGHGP
jgi:hypothetical protein